MLVRLPIHCSAQQALTFDNLFVVDACGCTRPAMHEKAEQNREQLGSQCLSAPTGMTADHDPLEGDIWYNIWMVSIFLENRIDLLGVRLVLCSNVFTWKLWSQSIETLPAVLRMMYAGVRSLYIEQCLMKHDLSAGVLKYYATR